MATTRFERSPVHWACIVDWTTPCAQANFFAQTPLRQLAVIRSCLFGKWFLSRRHHIQRRVSSPDITTLFAMNSSCRLLSTCSVRITRRISAAAGGGGAAAARRSVVGTVTRSFSSTQPEKAVCYEDFVKETLKKMVSERGTENLTREIADLDLERRFQHYDVSSFRDSM